MFYRVLVPKIVTALKDYSRVRQLLASPPTRRRVIAMGGVR